jgi:GT2 family glycosyltransferase
MRTRTIVVDAASADDTVDRVRAVPEVELVALRANLGYAGAINVGRAHARPFARLLIVNADVRLGPGCVEALARALDEDPAAGVGVPKLFDGRGERAPSLRREPSLGRACGDALFGRRWRSRPGWLSEMVWDERAYERPQTVEWATGAVLLVSEACDARVGPWDERYFLYSEEVDHARRAREAGFRIRYVPQAMAWHAEGGSGTAATSSALLAVNRIRYYATYHRDPTVAVFRAIVLLHELLRCGDRAHRQALRAVASRAVSTVPARTLAGVVA